MAECIIARGGSKQQEQIPIISDRAQILVTVKSSNNEVIPNSSVHCKDGSTWYNYTTNEKGQTLFVTNSGQCSITAYNFSIAENCKYMDQLPAYSNNIDTPIGSVKKIELTLQNRSDVEFNTWSNANIFNTYGYWTGNYKIIAHNKLNAFLGGAGGGGGGGTYATYERSGCGGGGGGINIINGFNVEKNSTYKIYVGVRGIGYNWIQNRNGTSGGTTTAFGYVANGGGGGMHGAFGYDGIGIGGGSGSYFGGNGGYSYEYRSDHNYTNGQNSNISNWGGGGGGGCVNMYGMGGRSNAGGPYGGYCYDGNGTDGTNGGGGGGAGWTGEGGAGGNGKITIHFYD